MTVGTIADLVAPIDSGAGDALPAQGTACTVAIQIVQTIAFTGSNVKALAVSANCRSSVTFWSAAAAVAHFDFGANGGQVAWCPDIVATGPLTGSTIASVRLSCGTTTLGASYVAWDAPYDSVE